MMTSLGIRASLCGVLFTALSACSSNDDDSSLDSAPSSAATIAGQTVDAAVSAFPNQILPRFALSNSTATAAEIYRRTDYTTNTGGVVSWGVEGASDDETFELESRYDTSASLLETTRNDVLTRLPANVQAAVDQRYPGAVITEMEQSTVDGNASIAILLEDTTGIEREANYNSNAVFLFEELIIDRAEVPSNVLATVDALPITLPDSEFESITLANGTVSYAVEFESDEGQSISISLLESGVITRVEHEEALENLSTSDTVETALTNFPQGISADFATMFSEVNAAEIFRVIDFSSVAAGEVSYGIEGVSADELLEVEALYSAEAVFLFDVRGLIIDALPAPVQTAFDAQYPGAEVEEIAETTDAQGIQYAVAFMQNGDEGLEANYDATGVFLSLENILEEDEIPQAILTAIGNERVLLPIVEFESVTDNQQTIQYVAEYENESGDSISYLLNDVGTILSIAHEAALPR